VCRLLAVVSAAAQPLRVSLAGMLPGFTALSAFHQDGWGVAARSGSDVTVAKQPRRALDDEAYATALGTTVTDAGLVHIRWATPGLTPCLGNTHPFVRDGIAFAHNGSAEPVDAIWKLVDDDLRGDLEGDTDSEAYFRAVLSAMRRVDVPSALLQTGAALRELTTISGLNVMLLTDEALWVYADHDPESAPSKRHGPDYFPIRYRREEAAVVVSSTGYEPVTLDWDELPQRHVLRVGRGSLDVDVIAP
jgi:predicted glutamine amidotransferase